SSVTGVQACALPLSGALFAVRRALARAGLGRFASGRLLAVDMDAGRQERPGPPVAVEDRVVDRSIVPAAREDRSASGADLLAILEGDDLERAREVDLGGQVDRQAGGTQ